MADFDFDEIDKAVTSAIGGTTGDVTEPSTPVTPSQSFAPDTQRASQAVTPATAPAARRGTGRFMDVVHPSSDMRTATGSTTPAPVSRPPVVAPVTDMTIKSEPVASSDGDILGEDWAKPLESPFLPDAKVEKRPLGGEAPTAPTQADFDTLELLEAPDDPQIEAHTMPDPIDFALQTNSKTDEAIDQDLKQEIEPQLSEPVGQSEDDDDDDGSGYGAGSFQPAEASMSASIQPAPADEPTGPTSITQQYQEQPSALAPTVPIYDTEAYHQPVPNIPKKKSGMWVIIWIILLILLGGGAGAAVYFYVLPLL